MSCLVSAYRQAIVHKLSDSYLATLGICQAHQRLDSGRKQVFKCSSKVPIRSSPNSA